MDPARQAREERFGHQAVTGVDGDPTASTPALGKLFLDYKVDAAVAQIRALRGAGK
jgi:creatinine amidohydrolase/Fe(II)-dependent formamide hydrolase-like protein